MKIKYLKDEAFSDYKKAYMFIGTCHCTFKCCIEAGLPITTCQNSEWNILPEKNINNSEIIWKYLHDPITSAVVFGGMEPMDQFDELLEFIKDFREVCDDDIVIYTGYREEELTSQISKLKKFINIIIKFGRFVPNQESHYDEVLGIELASDNQFAERLS